MLGKGSFKDSANRPYRYNQLKSLKLSMATREGPLRMPPHWRQTFPN
jgi:hypothetical protein